MSSAPLRGDYTNRKYQGESIDTKFADKTLPNEQRSFTDTLCCLVFVLGWIATFIIAALAFKNGDPTRLAQAYDSAGNACGSDDKVAEYPYIYFANPKSNATLFKMTVCVKECPQGNEQEIKCVPNKNVISCNKNVEVEMVIYASRPVLNKFCIPTNNVEFMKKIQPNLNMDGTENTIADIKYCPKIIAAMAGVALILGFIWMYMIRYVAKVLVWLTLGLLILLLLVFGLLCIGAAGYYRDQAKLNATDETIEKDYRAQSNIALFAGIVLLVLFLVFTIIVILLRKFINVAAALLGMSAKFVTDTPTIIIFPPIMFVVLLFLLLFFIIVGLYLYSSGEAYHDDKTISPFAKVRFSQTYRGFFIFNFIFGFWNLVFNIGYTEFVIACSACLWYFKEEGKSGSKLDLEIVKSAWRGLRYHIGTVAFASFVLSFIWTIRWIVSIIGWVLDKAEATENGLLVFLSKCCKCLFDCFFRFIRFMVNGAYSQCAIQGTNFLESGRQNVLLFVRNTGVFSIASIIVSGFLALGQAVITLATVVIGFTIISNSEIYVGKLHSRIAPTICFAVVGYFISTIFMNVYSSANDAILNCLAVEMDTWKIPRKRPELLEVIKDLK